MATQTANLHRVRSRIADLVLAFVEARLSSNPTFRGAELVAYVSQFESCSPSSPDRILRLLAQEGRVSYQILNRRQSLYRLIPKRAIQRELFA